jgi:hypothetical protein
VALSDIQRKLLLCALQKNDLVTAKDLFQSMAEATREQPITLYLGFKLAIRSGDREMATQCLRAVAASASKDPKFLYACCVDAQESGDRPCALEALKQLAERHQSSNVCSIHLPALFRVIVRLQMAIFKDEDQPDVDRELMVDDICRTFESGISCLFPLK